MNDDEFLFVADDDEPESNEIGYWKVLIVDDEPEVHAITKLALNDFTLNGRALTFMSAFDGEESKRVVEGFLAGVPDAREGRGAQPCAGCAGRAGHPKGG